MTRYDINLLNAMRSARAHCADLPLDGDAERVRQIAVSLLENSITEYEAAVEQDTTEVAEAAESREDLQEARGQLSRSFGRLRMALQMEFNRRRLAEEASEDLDEDVDHFLRRYSVEEFQASSLRTAVDVTEVGCEFAERYLKDAYRDQLIEAARAATGQALQAQEVHRKEEHDVVDSKGELEERRRQADETYMTVRHLMRAALRLASRETELSTLMPTLRQALKDGAA